MRLGHLQELGTEQSLVASTFVRATDQDLAAIAERPPRQRRTGWFTKAIAMLAATYIAFPSNPILSSSTDASRVPLSSSTVAPETLLPNRVTIYSPTNSPDVLELTKVVNDFPRIWNDTDSFVDIPKDEWMKILLRDDWESKMPAKAPRVYPLGIEDRKVVDKTFDKLHEQERMSWSTTSTPFSYPVFVV